MAFDEPPYEGGPSNGEMHPTLVRWLEAHQDEHEPEFPDVSAPSELQLHREEIKVDEGETDQERRDAEEREYQRNTRRLRIAFSAGLVAVGGAVYWVLDKVRVEDFDSKLATTAFAGSMIAATSAKIAWDQRHEETVDNPSPVTRAGVALTLALTGTSLVAMGALHEEASDVKKRVWDNWLDPAWNPRGEAADATVEDEGPVDLVARAHDKDYVCSDVQTFHVTDDAAASNRTNNPWGLTVYVGGTEAEVANAMNKDGVFDVQLHPGDDVVIGDCMPELPVVE